MSVIQFLRIFWARRLMIVVSACACLVGGALVGLFVPPVWEAHSQVLLNLLKPDPVTGMVVSGAGSRSYVATQIQLVQNYSVAGEVVDLLALQSRPEYLDAYNGRPRNDTRDFRRWAADRLIKETKVDVLLGSNILDIGFKSDNQDDAAKVADAFRQAYIDTSLAFFRRDATRNADWYSQQGAQAKAALDTANTAKQAFEKANGIVLQDNKLSVDDARLQALAQQGSFGGGAMVSGGQETQADAQLATVDAQIAALSKTLGPNHPDIIALRERRSALTSEAARERSAAASSASMARAASAGIGALNRAVDEQKAKVISESDKVEQLRQLQAEVDLRSAQYDAAMTKAAQLRQDAGAADTGLTNLGPAAPPASPMFPNWLLIIPGSLGLGLGVGVLMALLTELFARRVRGPEDLQSSFDAPLLAVIAAPAKPKKRGLFGRRGRVMKWPRGRRIIPA